MKTIYHMITEKKCYRCQTIKPVSEYNRHKNEIGGYKNQCRECCKAIRKENYARNKDKQNVAAKRYKEEHKKEISEASKVYRKANPDKVKKWKRAEYSKRRNNKQTVIEEAVGRAIRKRIKFNKQFGHWKEVLGYTVEDLMEHLEKKFTPEMNWDNYGTYWHIDHIRPKSWFEYTSTDSEAFKQCWALDNLQPLEASLNCSKGNRYEG